ncbi:hypothetical protein KFL_006790040 [Klebsormidium nitens]|uniref:Chromo domain-containing protein n=1 Tax=Klebsormidium nitens TaxID=105231 RepID=A0A1Y1INK5_KLENI|nr:hypothetical protein KFL_006790040 [Klebsormidium nitens]|eukprot:GAQ90741.1 hypothetical protein KFL_006790040 [Klebsormidium nitens]
MASGQGKQQGGTLPWQKNKDKDRGNRPLFTGGQSAENQRVSAGVPSISSHQRPRSSVFPPNSSIKDTQQTEVPQDMGLGKEATMLSLVMEPLNMAEFLTLLAALDLYPQPFPERSNYIADIINNERAALSAKVTSIEASQAEAASEAVGEEAEEELGLVEPDEEEPETECSKTDVYEDISGDLDEEVVFISESRSRPPELENPQSKKQKQVEVQDPIARIADAPWSLRTRRGQARVEDENVYNVERVIKSRIRNGKEEFWTKWEGESVCTWETEENLTCFGSECVEDYRRAQLPGNFYEADRTDLQPDDAEQGDDKTQRVKAQSCSPRTYAELGKGRTAGSLWAFRACGYSFPPNETVLCESSTQVWHYLCELFRDTDFPEFVGFDDMCHLARFILSGERTAVCPKAAEFARVKAVVDKFHFDKNHVGKWCKEHVNPHHHPELTKANMSICEQRFSWFGKYKHILRKMNEHRFHFLLLILCQIDHIQRDRDLALRRAAILSA